MDLFNTSGLYGKPTILYNWKYVSLVLSGALININTHLTKAYAVTLILTYLLKILHGAGSFSGSSPVFS
jgi:hypothetical protein